MRFSYKGQEVVVPVVPSIYYLGLAARNMMLPRLEELAKMRQTGEKVGIAFVPYHYATDSFEFTNPKATQALMNALKKAGLPVADSPKKLDSISPEPVNLLQMMCQRGDYYWTLSYVSEGTFLVGPMRVAVIPRIPGLYDYADEIEASTLETDATIGIHGAALLEDFVLPKGRDRIFNQEIVDILERVIPVSYSG